MEGDARDLELEWLNARIELSNRALSRMLDVHYEVVRRAKLTGHLTDALRGNIRKYMAEHPGGGEDGSQQEDKQQSSAGDAGDHGKSAEPGDTSKAAARGRRNKSTGDADRPVSKRRRGGRRGRRRGTSDERRTGDEGRVGDDGSTGDESATDEKHESALRLMYEVVGCRDTQQLAEITARIRKRYGVGGGPSGAPEPFYTRPTEASLDELKAHALSLLSGVPVVAELSIGAAISATRAVLNDEVSLLEPPLLLHGDAVLLLVMRAQAGYEDPGAREVEFVPAGRLYACGMRAEELRDGVTIEERMRRYACDDHRDRPRLIGMRFSDVIPEKPYPDEDWFFGSTGWTDADGAWRPGRAELIARWRHVAGMCEDWGAERPTTRGSTRSPLRRPRWNLHY